ncbi:accessory factor UbiK family protein [Thiomicrorhabdus indica]|uniref:accessory factor UbiK family protein n=1 Tax=Thiomicrorhabdus indica TaxID=2267253 RepID=UPI00102D82BB|nr:accessory factor UbiK family protein [Thiomicrorhabdus indica]
MIQPPPIDQLIGQLSKSIPQGFGDQNDQIKQQMKSILSRWLEEMDFVTREEFEVQKAVLQKTRQKLDELSQRLDEIDAGHD